MKKKKKKPKNTTTRTLNRFSEYSHVERLLSIMQPNIHNILSACRMMGHWGLCANELQMT